MRVAAATRERPRADGDLVTWMAGTQLLARAVSLILYLRERDEAVTVGELANALDVPPNTAYRLVRTLELGGLVDRSHRPYVSLGLRFMDLGQAKQRQVTSELAPVALPVLEALTAETGETSLLLMPTGARAICILAVEPSRAIRLSYRPGRVLPLYAGASGKVMLPWVSAGLLATVVAQAEGQVLADGRRLTARGIKSELKSIKARGYCVTHDELDAGASAVAAPVFTRGGQILASVSIAGPAAGFTEDRLPALIERVVAAAAETSRGLARSWATPTVVRS
jgi:IclR family transcriptional regulator, acetate operon repressor